MTPKISFIAVVTVALVFAVPAFGDSWGADQRRATVRVSPDLADRVRAILSSTTNAVLGTIRRDGSPRLSGADPYFHDGQLRIWSMPRARKGQDLRRDPRVALHSIPWDSRRLRDGAADVGAADAKVSGTAVLSTDAGDLTAFRAWLKSERGFEPPEDWDLFTIDIDALAVISADGGQLVVDRWSNADVCGRRRSRAVHRTSAGDGRPRRAADRRPARRH